MRETVFSLLFLFLFQFSNGQKIMKGIDAYNNSKYEKAATIFIDVLEKDSNDIVAQIGFCQSNISQHDINKANLLPSVYKYCYYLMNKAINNLSFSDTETKKLLSEKLLVSSTSELIAAKTKLSGILWNDYYAAINLSDSVQYFFDKYCYGENLKKAVSIRMSTLYFEKAKKNNTVEAYESFLTRFPQAAESEKAKEAIEYIEVSFALSDGSTTSLERTIKKYPNSPKSAEMRKQLAISYFKSINVNADTEKIQRVIKQLKSLHTDDANNLIDSCRYFLFLNEYRSASLSNNPRTINTFLNNYDEFNNLTEYKTVLKRKLDLLYEKILNDYNVNYTELHDFLVDAPLSYPGLDKIISKSVTDFSKKWHETIENSVSNFFSENSNINSDFHYLLTRLILQNMPVSFNIDTLSLYNNIKLSENDNAPALIKAMKMSDQIDESELSIKANTSDWSIITIRKKNNNGSYTKTTYAYKINENAYKPISDLKTIEPIYAALKRKNGILFFSTPEIIGKTYENYDIEVYGFLPGDKPCCPSYRVVINYEQSKNSFAPKSLQTLEQFSDNISESDNGYYYISNILF